MTEIDPQQFGELKAQVASLLHADEERMQILRELSNDITAMRLQMAEARGGWKVIMLLGGAAASLGGAFSWVLGHMTGKGMP
jgi:hypothetical protein